MSEEEKKEKFKVYDKRKFDDKGNPREPDQEEEKPSEFAADINAGDSKPGPENKAAESEGGAGARKASGAFPETIDFKTFLISLGSQAMMALGLLVPQGEKPEPDIEAARHLIDILAMLREKTRGNLEADEITTIDNLLYDLRMAYVEIKKRQEG